MVEAQNLRHVFALQEIRRKDGKDHRAWSVVENRRVHDGRVVQRQVLYLGEINDNQKAAWSKAIEVFDEGAGQSKQIALFPEDRLAPVLDCDVVSIRLSAMRLRRPRQWGACWMATLLWDQLRLDEFWLAALPPSREGTSWLNILKTLVGYQLISPGSEWRLHRHWFEHSAMGDLLGEDIALVQLRSLTRCSSSARWPRGDPILPLIATWIPPIASASSRWPAVTSNCMMRSQISM